MTQKRVIGLLVLLTIALTACGVERQSAPSADVPPSSLSTESEAAAQLPPDPPQSNLFRVALDSSATELTGFLYSENQPYIQTSTGGLMPEMGVSSALFSCRKGEHEAYGAEQAALVDRLAEALSHIEIDQQSRTKLQGEDPLPDTDDYLGFWLTLGDWEPFLYLFDSGDVYVEANGRPDHSAYRYKLTDTADYQNLIRTLAEIENSIDHMPLDYNFSLFVWLDPISPESEAVKLFLQNNSGRPVQFSSRFTVEYQVDGRWQALEELDPMAHEQAMGEIPPRSSMRWGIDLRNLKNGREPGRYRVTNAFGYAGEEGTPFSVEYVVSAENAEMSYAPPPAMTPENREYCERYIEMWGFYNPFRDDFAQGAYPPSFHTYHLYYILSGMEGIRNSNADLPAEMVEGVIARHFAVTPEQIRALSHTVQQSPGEHYNPGNGTYHFEGGYGGGSLTGIVSESSLNGNLLTLTCRWYGMDDAFSFENVVTLLLGPGESDFRYASNRVTEMSGEIANFS